ncbi:MAG: hypothetical protein IJC02_10345 [Lachnospiraceae bacterium]|nr:hypothetical protein [Lachnospiraceae bacterium]
MITEKELQEITEKYSYYLSQARIDIARSQVGKVYFIEFDKYGQCNSFYMAEDRNELDTIIKINQLENLECVMEVSIEEMNHQLQSYDLQDVKIENIVNYEERLHVLVKKLELVYGSIKRVYGEVFRE